LGGAIVALAAAAGPAQAQVQPYGTNDYGVYRNVLPPGQGKAAKDSEVFAYLGSGALPAHWDDQRNMYGDLVYGSPSLAQSQIGQYFKDATFGVRPADVASTISPRPGVTIIRDTAFGVPHVYGDTRADVMYGAGYAGAQDRLFFMDVLRHSGRGQLSEFAGRSNKAMDASVWDNAPYTEADLQRQYDLADDVYGAAGRQLQLDVQAYVDGINKYITEVKATPSEMPGEYGLLGRTLNFWQPTDVIATSALVGGIFGKGGGGELSNSEVYTAARARFGKVKGVKVWKDFRRAEDPEAPTTVHGRRFPYQVRRGIDPKSVAIPDRGSLIPGSPDDASATAHLASAGDADDDGSAGMLDQLLKQGGASNALVVSARESQSGHPLAVFGPQVSYFSPQILLEEDLHGPGIDARGAAFVGVNLYVLLGHGEDYSWSATSAGQDIIDTFAEKLCEPGGGKPTVHSMSYLWHGQCRPIEVLDRVNNITPTAIDPGPAETYRLSAQRTVHGIVSQRGTVDGVPVAFARQRSTYGHEADSALGFSILNDPSQIHDARDFQLAAARIGFTFNWLYADDRDTAYFNSGNNPVRAKGTDPEFPSWGTGRWDWRDWNPDLNIARYTSLDSHPQVINQDYLTSWNNKQAPGFHASEAAYNFGSIHRVLSLNERVQARIAGKKKISLTGLIDAMEDAGTVDLRGSQVLPWMLKVIRRGGVPRDLRDEVGVLSSWVRAGAHRRDMNHDGVYDDTRAVALMDAWWPKLLEGIYRPSLGAFLFDKLKAAIAFDDPPGAKGSAYIAGWYSYVEKDLRALLGRKVRGGFSRSYCGSGKGADAKLHSCKGKLTSTLRTAITVPRSQLYPRGDDCATGDDQVCNDAVRFSTTGAIGAKEIHWINRPTFQQAVEVVGHRGRGDDRFCVIPRIGTNASEHLLGTALADRIVAHGGNDDLVGSGGNDCLNGQAGNDTIEGGGGRDRLKGGGGDDVIHAADGDSDRISCGGGADRVRADRHDRVAGDCEDLSRPAGRPQKR
jgi:hypothetical protein